MRWRTSRTAPGLAEPGTLADPTLVLQSVAAPTECGRSPAAHWPATAALTPRRLLVVLDNREHLLDSCARLADALLRACPHVRLLCTSREALGGRPAVAPGRRRRRYDGADSSRRAQG